MLKINKFSFNIYRNTFLLTGIFIGALLIRLIYLYQLKSTPLFGFFAADSYFYDKFAAKILEGNLLYKETIYLNPLYPFFLSGIYGIFGHNLTAVAIAQIILDSFSCVFLYLICLKIFNPSATLRINKKSIALLASFIYACYGIAIFYTGFLLDTSLVVFLHLALMFTLLSAKDKRSFGLWLLSGILIGLIMLLKANIILFLPFLMLWLFCLGKEKQLSRKILDLGCIFTGIVIMLFPFSVRNYMIERRFSPLPVQGGLNFYIGNNPAAQGNYLSLAGIPDSPVEQAQVSIRRAKKETGKDLTSRGASRYWFGRGFKFIKNNPRQYLKLSIRKLLLFWNRAEIDGNLNYYFSKKFLPIFKLPFFSFGFIAPLAILGFIFAARQRRAGVSLIMLFIFAYMVSVVLYFINSRYRFACVPFVIIFAAYALQDFIRLLQSARIKEFLLFFLLFLVFFSIVNRDMYNQRLEESFFTDHTNLGIVYHEKGMLDKAIAEFQKALKLNPDYAEAHHNLGIVYMVKGLPEKAIQEYQRALAINSDYAEAHYNLGVAYYKKGWAEEAIVQYREAINISPELSDAYNNLGTAYISKGMFEEAIAEYKKALANNPDFADARYNLAVAYDKQGMLDKAIQEYKRALAINSDYADAHNNLAICYYRKGDRQQARHHYIKALDGGLKLRPEFFQELFGSSIQLFKPGAQE